MDKKRFRKFVIGYIVNLTVIALMVAVLILASNGIIPEIFQGIALLVVIADVIWFRGFAKNFRQ